MNKHRDHSFVEPIPFLEDLTERTELSTAWTPGNPKMYRYNLNYVLVAGIKCSCPSLDEHKSSGCHNRVLAQVRAMVEPQIPALRTLRIPKSSFMLDYDDLEKRVIAMQYPTALRNVLRYLVLLSQRLGQAVRRYFQKNITRASRWNPLHWFR